MRPGSLTPKHPGARPTPCKEAEGARSESCRHYGGCLDHALVKNWKGFHCVDCALCDDLSREEQRQDLEGLAAFLTALYTTSRTYRTTGNAPQVRARRDRLIAAGLCESCGLEPARPNRRRCVACARKVAARVLAGRRMHG